MKYQLVLQFETSDINDFDQLIEIEDRLENTLDQSHEVDGHDFGSGEMNIFIYTENPSDAFVAAKVQLIQSELNGMKAAFRETDGDTYTVLWPNDFSGEFNVT
jgi:hypothetical protein